ncbi:Hexuronate transporter [Paraburkholderia caffeinitolerans]|uniref:Hexuronate transporter n=1 Tax=Paraburkholderia caffeinitolerans TaxID=1723730 RepID=A0A6J5G9E6_9BURK|nr:MULTISPECIES: MFS transporter [Paraburkholderia]CAB3795688.1 Hexuronate transporter [Paraburkholderia caffeinitolerans]
MSASPAFPASSAYQPKPAWIIAALLTGLAMINFLDKIVLGMVAVPLMAEMHLSPAQFGLVAGSFFWLFSTSTVIVGFLSNRIATRWILLAMGASWSILQLPQAFTDSAAALLICRVLLGAAEGPSFPTSVHALFKWFPDQKRSVPVAIVNQGAVLGMILAGVGIPLITLRWGWRVNFFVLAATGCVWCVLWLCFGREGALGAQTGSSRARVETDPAAQTPERLPYLRILTDASVLCVFLLGFVAYWLLGQTITWLPTYLEKGLGFSSIVAGRWFALVIAFAAPVVVGLSMLSQSMMKHGATTREARARLSCVTMIAGALLFIALATVELTPLQKVLCYAMAGALPMLCLTLAPAMLAEMVPLAQRGSVIAINTAVSSLGAAVGPAVAGRIIQSHTNAGSHAYELGILVTAVLLIVAALVALRWLHPERSMRTLNRESAPLAA